MQKGMVKQFGYEVQKTPQEGEGIIPMSLGGVRNSTLKYCTLHTNEYYAYREVYFSG